MFQLFIKGSHNKACVPRFFQVSKNPERVQDRDGVEDLVEVGNKLNARSSQICLTSLRVFGTCIRYVWTANGAT